MILYPLTRRRPFLPVTRSLAAALRALFLISLMCAPTLAGAQSLVWVHQFPGTSRGLAVDQDGNIVTASNTTNLDENKGESTIRKFDPLGNVIWEELISESNSVLIWSIAAAADGRVAVAGRIGGGDFSSNAFVRSFDASGAEQWSDTFGDEVAFDEAQGLAFDADGNLYVGGRTSGSIGVSQGGPDGFLRKYDAAGTVLWTEQFGTPAIDDVMDVATDAAGHVLLTGRTTGDLGAPVVGDSYDGFLRKHDSAGAVVWTQQFGTAGTTTWSLSLATAPDDSVLLAGLRLGGGLPNSHFVARHDASGAMQWLHFVPSQPFDLDAAVAADTAGNALLAGMTAHAEIFGPDIAGGDEGGDDAFIQKRLAADGSLEWSVRLSGQGVEPFPSFDKSLAVATFGSGNIYLSGETTESYGYFGDGNGFVARLVSGLSTADIGKDVAALPAGAFKGTGHQSAIQSILADIHQFIASGDVDQAISGLLNLRRHLDGCEDGPPADGNDWIVDCAAQDLIRTLVDALLAELS